MSCLHFFSAQTGPSRTKSEIVSKYFTPWARIVGARARERGQPVGYLDLFSGPGRYDDGSESTPLLVLRRAVADPLIRDLLVAKFNDANPSFAAALRREIDSLPGIGLLSRRPRVYNLSFGPDLGADVRATRFPPTLFFVDPYGYKGLTRALIAGALKDWGCEIVFFFNFNRVNAAIPNDCVSQHIDELFGDEAAERLRDRIGGLSRHEREQAVIDNLVQSIRKGGDFHVQHFAFMDARGSRTSHYLVHVTKNAVGHHIMTDIMAKASSWSKDGVASFVCGPQPEPTLFDGVVSPLDDLKVKLVADYTGRSATFGEIWGQHSLGRQYTQKNYRDALLQLEGAGRVFVECPSDRRRRPGTVPEWATIHFATCSSTTVTEPVESQSCGLPD